jgi:hypothetical protein
MAAELPTQVRSDAPATWQQGGGGVSWPSPCLNDRVTIPDLMQLPHSICAPPSQHMPSETLLALVQVSGLAGAAFLWPICITLST